MKKGTKIFFGASAVLVSAFALSACSSSGSGSSGGKETIQVFSTKTENVATLKELAAKFTKANPNITVNIVAPADGGTVLKTDLTKNQIPDVISGGGDANFLMLEKAGVLQDLSKQSYVSNLQDSYVKQVKSMYSGDALYGAPYATNASGVIYNKDLFTKAGITAAPKTWDDFTKDVAALKAKGIVPLELDFQGADDWTAMAVWNSIAPSLQPANFGQDRLNNKVTFSADMKPVAQKFLDVIKLAQPNFMGTSYNNGLQDFANGKAAMLINGSWTVPVIRQTNAKINFGLIPFPTTNDTSKNYLSSGVDVLFAVSKNSKHQDADQKFISFMMESENAQTYSKEQEAFSAIKGVEQTDAPMVAASKEIQAGNVADYPDHLYPAGFTMAGILSQFSLNQTKGMDDNANITQFLKTADQQYNTANVK